MKKFNDLISLIIPIYNVELYIDDCINTLIKQTYQNLEIILVDDGSTDNCPSICDYYEKKDKRIKVIHKKNGGLSDARNSGLKIAKGEYVVFIDSDDFVNIDFVKNLYYACIQNNADMAVCQYQKVTTIKDVDWKENKTCNNDEVITGREFSINIYKGQAINLGFVAWNKIYKKDLFINNNIEYPINKYHEDTFTTFRLLYLTNRIVIVNIPLYYYRIREGSIMTSNADLKRLLDMLEAAIYPVKYYDKKNDKELLSLSLNYFFKDTIDTYKKFKTELYVGYIKECYTKYWTIYHNKLNTKIVNKLKYKYFYYKFCDLKIVKGRD